jgi:hypothetical protein
MGADLLYKVYVFVPLPHAAPMAYVYAESLKLSVHDFDRQLLAGEPLYRNRRKGCCCRCEAVDQAVSLSLGWSASIGMAQTWSATSTTLRTHSAQRLIDFCCIVVKIHVSYLCSYAWFSSLSCSV